MFKDKKKPDEEEALRQNGDQPQLGLSVVQDGCSPPEGLLNDSGAPQEKKTLIPNADLDRMVAESLKDIESDGESSGDENDPDLLNELQAITGESIAVANAGTQPAPEAEEREQVFLPTTTINVINVIKERIKMYEAAEQNAKTSGEESRARRFARGLKTLNDLLKQASAGSTINVDDIPPEVSVKTHQNPSSDECQSP